MVSSAATTQDLSLLLEQLQAQEAALKADIESRLATLVRHMATAAALRKAVEMATQALGAPPVATAPPHASLAHEGTEAAPMTVKFAPKPALASKSADDWTQLLSGLTQRAALRRIAEENGGVLNTAEAGRILVAAGLVTGNPRYAGSHLYNIVKKSPHFAYIAPGTFRLTAPAAPSDPPAVAVEGMEE